MNVEVSLKDVSVRFKVRKTQSDSLKEAALRALNPPAWLKKQKQATHSTYGLKKLNLSLEEGDRLGILGHNGAGKSTLLKVISRIYRPQEGSVSVEGRIAPLIEIGAGFNPELTGRENVYLNGAILGLSKSVIKNKMNSIVEFSDLKEYIDVPVKYYSTGMHLRLAFTIATEITPDILILDELFSGADASFLERAETRLREFVHKSKILILVSHNLDYITQFCNKAMVMQQGEVKAMGSPQEMIELYLNKYQGRVES